MLLATRNYLLALSLMYSILIVENFVLTHEATAWNWQSCSFSDSHSDLEMLLESIFSTRATASKPVFRLVWNPVCWDLLQANSGAGCPLSLYLVVVSRGCGFRPISWLGVACIHTDCLPAAGKASYSLARLKVDNNQSKRWFQEWGWY